METIHERYITFKNIDCFEKSCRVLDELLNFLEKRKDIHNPFWERFIGKIPKTYYSKEKDEDILYLVCANVFYIDDLFEENDYEPGIAVMRDCELECC